MIIFNNKECSESFLIMMIAARYRLFEETDGTLSVHLPYPYRGVCGTISGEDATKFRSNNARQEKN